MQSIKPQLTGELIKHASGLAVWRAPAFKISDYRALARFLHHGVVGAKEIRVW
jgi:hypothetical protein